VARRRALASLDRWREQYDGRYQPADPPDQLAARVDWIRAQIMLIRRVHGPEEADFMFQLNEKVREWALHIDREIRATIGEAP